MTPIFQNQKITQWVPWGSDSQTAPGIGHLTTDFLLSSIHLNFTEESTLLRYEGSMMTKTDINPSLSRALILVRKETVHTSNTTGHIWVAERLAGGGGGPKPKGVRQQGGWACIQRKSEKTTLIQEGQQALWVPGGRTSQEGLRLQSGMPDVFKKQEGGQWGWGRMERRRNPRLNFGFYAKWTGSH